MTAITDIDEIADEIMAEIDRLTGRDPELLRQAEEIIRKTSYLNTREGESNEQD